MAYNAFRRKDKPKKGQDRAHPPAIPPPKLMLSLKRLRSGVVHPERTGGAAEGGEVAGGGGALLGEVEVPWNVVDILGGGPLLCMCSAPGSKTASADLTGTAGDAEGSAR